MQKAMSENSNSNLSQEIDKQNKRITELLEKVTKLATHQCSCISAVENLCENAEKIAFLLNPQSALNTLMKIDKIVNSSEQVAYAQKNQARQKTRGAFPTTQQLCYQEKIKICLKIAKQLFYEKRESEAIPFLQIVWQDMMKHFRRPDLNISPSGRTFIKNKKLLNFRLEILESSLELLTGKENNILKNIIETLDNENITEDDLINIASMLLNTKMTTIDLTISVQLHSELSYISSNLFKELNLYNVYIKNNHYNPQLQKKFIKSSLLFSIKSYLKNKNSDYLSSDPFIESGFDPNYMPRLKPKTLFSDLESSYKNSEQLIPLLGEQIEKNSFLKALKWLNKQEEIEKSEFSEIAFANLYPGMNNIVRYILFGESGIKPITK